MSHQKLAEQIERAAAQLALTTEKLIKRAFKRAFGETSKVEHEAKLAHTRFQKRGTFSERTFYAISRFISHALGWPELKLT